MKQVNFFMIFVCIVAISVTASTCGSTRNYQKRIAELVKENNQLYNQNKELHEANCFKYELLEEFFQYKQGADSIIEECYLKDDVKFLDALMKEDPYWDMVDASNAIDSLMATQL